MDLKKTIGIVFFVMLLTVGVANAGITNVEMYGSNQVSGFMKSTDTFHVEGTFEISGDTSISTNQVKFGNSNADSCTQVTGGFKCIANVVEESYSASKLTVPVKLYTDSGALDSEEEYSIIIDGYPAIVDILFEGGSIAGGAPVVINYEATDRAYPDGVECSGIKGISFFVSPVSEEEFVIDSLDCAIEGSIEIGVDPTEESVEICGAAYDGLDQTGPWDCITVNVDSIAPAVVPDSLTVIGVQDGIIGPDATFLANVTIELVEESLDTVTADFSGVNLEANSYTLSADNCIYIDIDKYECEFNDVEFKLGSNPTVSIMFVATDDAGNIAQEAVEYTFSLDAIGPEPIAIELNGEDSEPQWVGAIIQTIDVTFKEEGSGMVAEKCFLDLSYFDLGDSIPANTCEELENGNWVCSWEEVSLPADSSDGNIGVSIKTEDVFGNPLLGSLVKHVSVDGLPAEILEFNLSQPDSEFVLPENMFVEGTPLIMEAKVGENRELLSCRMAPAWIKAQEMEGLSEEHTAAISDQKVDAEASSKFLDDFVTESCEHVEENTWRCTYILQDPRPGVYDLSYVFEDGAKNIVSSAMKITIIDLREEVTAYWDVNEIDRMPSKIDRGTSDMVHHQVLYSIGLKTDFVESSFVTEEPEDEGLDEVTGAVIDDLEAAGIETVEPATSVMLLKVSLGDCTGDIEFMEHLSLLDGTDLGNFPLIELILKQMELPHDRDSISLRCNISLHSLLSSGSDYWINENPEVKEVVLEVPFFDTEIPSVILEEKIEEALNQKFLGVNMVSITDSITFKTFERISEIGEWVVRADSILLNTGLAVQAITAIFPQFEAATAFSDWALKWHKEIKDYMFFITCDDGSIAENWLGKQPEIEEDTWALKKVEKAVTGWQVDSMEKLGYKEEDLLNPRRSLIASLTRFCVPGIVQNMRQIANIQCSYAYCLRTASDLGMAPTYCERLKSYLNCVAIGEEIDYFLPITKYYDSVAQAANTFLESPYSMVSGTIDMVCKLDDAIAVDILGPVDKVCDVILLTQAIKGVNTAIKSIEQAQSLVSLQAPTNYCDLARGTA